MGRHDESPDLSLDPPSTYVFTGEICTRSYALNRFAFAFKFPEHRRQFDEDPEKLMASYGLTEAQRELIRRRDWTGLIADGGHLLNIIKIAAAVGESHLHVGAHMCGEDWNELRTRLPRVVDVMPEDVG